MSLLYSGSEESGVDRHFSAVPNVHQVSITGSPNTISICPVAEIDTRWQPPNMFI